MYASFSFQLYLSNLLQKHFFFVSYFKNLVWACDPSLPTPSSCIIANIHHCRHQVRACFLNRLLWVQLTTGIFSTVLFTKCRQLRPVTLTVQSSALLHWRFIYLERESPIFGVFASQLIWNTFHFTVKHKLFFSPVFICLFVW